MRARRAEVSNRSSALREAASVIAIHGGMNYALAWNDGFCDGSRNGVGSGGSAGASSGARRDRLKAADVTESPAGWGVVQGAVGARAEAQFRRGEYCDGYFVLATR